MDEESRIPFTENIVGSWLFVRTTKTSSDDRLIYHFTKDGMNHWEMDCGKRRQLTAVRYRFSGNKLTLIYAFGSERVFELMAEENGSVRFPGADGYVWWMTRLMEPQSYSKAFVGTDGLLIVLNKE